MNAEQIKSILQLLLGAGGPLSALILSYGVPADRLTLWVNLAVAVVPPLLAGAWAIIDRTHKNTIAQAGVILAAPGLDGKPSGTIVVSPEAKNGSAAAADDPNVKNVNYAQVKP